MFSPNYDARKAIPIDFIVIHGTWMQSANDALSRLCDPESKVSCHYFIDETGNIIQLVDDQYRAWHAGISHWRGITDMNACSLGIELQNNGDAPYQAQQIDALIQLCKKLQAHYNIPHSALLGHSDIAPDRKDDPGVYFPWAALAKNKIGIFPDMDQLNHHIESLREMTPAEMKDRLDDDLTQLGYDPQARQRIRAFKLRYMPASVNNDPCPTALVIAGDLLRKQDRGG